MTINPIDGGGPWLFETSKSLSPDERELFDFRNMKYKGSRGWFRKYLPLDQLNITNKSSSETIEAEINGIYNIKVPPNSSETFDRADFQRIAIINDGSNAIAAGEVAVEVAKDAFDADDKALQQAKRPPAVKVISGILPGDW